MYRRRYDANFWERSGIWGFSDPHSQNQTFLVAERIIKQVFLAVDLLHRECKVCSHCGNLLLSLAPAELVGLFRE